MRKFEIEFSFHHLFHFAISYSIIFSLDNKILALYKIEKYIKLLLSIIEIIESYYKNINNKQLINILIIHYNLRSLIFKIDNKSNQINYFSIYNIYFIIMNQRLI